MLRRHSNPTKNKVWWPWQTRLLVGFGLRFFTGYGFWWVFTGLWRSCFIKNLVLLTKTFFLQKLVQNRVLIPRPVFFSDLVDTGYKLYIQYIYIYIYTHIFNIYIEFRCFGGICCGGILTVQKDKGLVAPAQQVGKFDQTTFEHFYPHLPA